MDPRFDLKAKEFTRFCQDMHSMLGNSAPDLRDLVDHEIARVLEKALQNTDEADRQKIRERVKNRSVFRIGGKRYITNFRGKRQRVPDAIWAEIEQKRRRSLLRKLAKVGLTKQSFFLLAAKLGQEIKAPGYVMNAKSEFKNPEVQANVSIAREGAGAKYGVMVHNGAPLLRWTNGRAAWFGALAGRIGFYHQNVKRGVFNKVETVMKKYRGLTLRSGS